MHDLSNFLTYKTMRDNISELEAEVSRLRNELAEDQLEKEILKKAILSSAGQCNCLLKSI